MKIDGGCHCGQISYEAIADPANVMVCHCTDCQTLTGSAFRTVVFTQEGSFKLHSGELKIYLKRGDSGAERQQAFCPECGTPIYSTTVGDGTKVHVIRLGTVRQRDKLTPKSQIWFRSAQPWVTELRAIPHVDTQPSFTDRGAVIRGDP